MGAESEPKESSAHAHAISADTAHRRQGNQVDGGNKDADAMPAASPAMANINKDIAQLLGPEAPRELTDADIDKVISGLPSWQSQLSLRGYIVGERSERALRCDARAALCLVRASCVSSVFPSPLNPLPTPIQHTHNNNLHTRNKGTLLGALFTIIGLKLTLGTAGILPSLNIPAGLISFAAIKSLTRAGASMRVSERAPGLAALLFQPFGLQENAVLQTYILSVGAGGFGSYITGMGYQAYLNLGGAPRGDPKFEAGAVFDPVPSKTMPYLVLTTVLGAFMLCQLRKLMIVDWRLPFPSGTASGIMLTSFHTAVRRLTFV